MQRGSRVVRLSLNSVGPGLWSGQSGKELVLAEPFLHPETERQATEVGRCGSGVWLEHRSIAAKWLQRMGAGRSFFLQNHQMSKAFPQSTTFEELRLIANYATISVRLISS